MSRDFRRMGALGVAAAAAVALGAAPASTAAAQPADPDFTLYAKEIPGEEEPTAPPAVGETFSFAEDLYRAKGGEKAGRSGVTCTVVRQGEQGGDVLCVGTFVLTGDPAGQLSVQTLTSYSLTDEGPSAFDVAITGGTGDFADARGYVRGAGEGDYQRLDFHLTD
ncbi:hypothetical protein [Streptomyces sp. NPDC047928]|uniref:hypothetical protein n=1 Tax=unclassified Streptomyces TaxID=2593676 RepID=UPI00371AADD2